MLKIGLSACFMYPDLNRKVFGPKTLLYMGYDMSHYLGLAGVMPILIPDLPNDKLFYQFLDQLDGLLLQGGLDVNPEHYGETPLNFEWEGDPQRDLYEFKILDYMIQKKKPVLGICRGLQLLNVYFGGTLYQDISQMLTGASKHQDNNLYDEHTHEVEFVKGGLLEKLHKKEQSFVVNSVHHQAIKSLGENLKVEAVCPTDQVIEAVILEEAANKGPSVIGIQWHPEFFHTMEANTLCGQTLLQYFLKLCEKRQKA